MRFLDRPRRRTRTDPVIASGHRPFPRTTTLACLRTLISVHPLFYRDWTARDAASVTDLRGILADIARDGEAGLGLPSGAAADLLYHQTGLGPVDLAALCADFETDETDTDLNQTLDLVEHGFTRRDSAAAWGGSLRLAVAHAWWRRYGMDTLTGCLRAGLGRHELAHAYQTGVMPDPAELALLAALRHPDTPESR